MLVVLCNLFFSSFYCDHWKIIEKCLNVSCGLEFIEIKWIRYVFRLDDELWFGYIFFGKKKREKKRKIKTENYCFYSRSVRFFSIFFQYFFIEKSMALLFAKVVATIFSLFFLLFSWFFSFAITNRYLLFVISYFVAAFAMFSLFCMVFMYQSMFYIFIFIFWLELWRESLEKEKTVLHIRSVVLCCFVVWCGAVGSVLWFQGLFCERISHSIVFKIGFVESVCKRMKYMEKIFYTKPHCMLSVFGSTFFQFVFLLKHPTILIWLQHSFFSSRVRILIWIRKLQTIAGQKNSSIFSQF